jgi:large subunit ribosomal protein L21
MSSLRIARPESGRIPATTQNTAICGQLSEILSMYAVIDSGVKQHRVEPGEVLRLEKLDASEGETINFDKVMMIGEGENVQIGTPFVDGGAVTAEVVSHGRGDKITIIKMRRRKHYRRQAGHRQYFTEVKIKDISGGN